MMNDGGAAQHLIGPISVGFFLLIMHITAAWLLFSYKYPRLLATCDFFN